MMFATVTPHSIFFTFFLCKICDGIGLRVPFFHFILLKIFDGVWEPANTCTNLSCPRTASELIGVLRHVNTNNGEFVADRQPGWRSGSVS